MIEKKNKKIKEVININKIKIKYPIKSKWKKLKL